MAMVVMMMVRVRVMVMAALYPFCPSHAGVLAW